LLLAVLDVFGHAGRIDGDDASAHEEGVQVLQSLFGLGEIAPAGGAVVGTEVFRDLVVLDAVRARQDRLPGRDAALTFFQKPPRLVLVLGARALAPGLTVHVVLDPPWSAAFAVASALLVDGAHFDGPPLVLPGNSRGSTRCCCSAQPAAPKAAAPSA